MFGLILLIRKSACLIDVDFAVFGEEQELVVPLGLPELQVTLVQPVRSGLLDLKVNRARRV